jgi:hypothetical protein
MSSGDLFPEIPIQQIQKVAVERCGLLQKEVTAQLLLATEEARESRDVWALPPPSAW